MQKLQPHANKTCARKAIGEYGPVSTLLDVGFAGTIGDGNEQRGERSAKPDDA